MRRNKRRNWHNPRGNTIRRRKRRRSRGNNRRRRRRIRRRRIRRRWRKWKRWGRPRRRSRTRRRRRRKKKHERRRRRIRREHRRHHRLSERMCVGVRVRVCACTSARWLFFARASRFVIPGFRLEKKSEAIGNFFHYTKKFSITRIRRFLAERKHDEDNHALACIYKYTYMCVYIANSLIFREHLKAARSLVHRF